MAYEVVSTAEFDADLDAAIAYRVETRGLQSARRLLDALDKASALLSATPRMGTLVNRHDANLSTNDLRWIKVDAYICVYRVHDAAETVVLAKMLYGTSNWRSRVLGC